MKLGQYAVVDERDPRELKNKRHEIAVVYDEFGNCVKKTQEYVGRYPGRKYVVLKAIALVEIDPQATRVSVLEDAEQENREILKSHIRADFIDRSDCFFGR